MFCLLFVLVCIILAFSRTFRLLFLRLPFGVLIRFLSVFVINDLISPYFLLSFFGEPLSSASGAGQGPLHVQPFFRVFSSSLSKVPLKVFSKYPIL